MGEGPWGRGDNSDSSKSSSLSWSQSHPLPASGLLLRPAATAAAAVAAAAAAARTPGVRRRGHEERLPAAVRRSQCSNIHSVLFSGGASRHPLS